VTQPATTDAAVPLSVRAVDRAARLLAGHESTRRRFLGRLAVFGSALALHPIRFILRPTPAYASVCGSGNSCGSGWTVFCCTINDGANTCPTGSFVAGWWKVDASAFCLGAPRYYIDCNRRPKAHCRCHCNDSGCDRRRVCCNVFRYGQCNTQIGGVTEVVCRVITCTPPWRWDPSCGRTVRTSPATRSHSSRCLPGKNPSHIDIKYQDLGLVGSKVGKPLGGERDGAGGGRKRGFEHGMILYHRKVGAHQVRRKLARRYRGLDAEAGPLGYPRKDHRRVGDGRGAFVRFQRGSIYAARGEPAREVLARADRRYRRLDGPRGRLGYPTAGTTRANGRGRVTRFENGAIYMSPRTPPIDLMGRVLAVFEERGGPKGSRLGFPSATLERRDDGGRVQRFERGVIAGPGPRSVFAVWGAVADRYLTDDGPDPTWGYPYGHTEVVPETEGVDSPFTQGAAFWSPTTAARWLVGPILARYREEGGPAGRLGFPVSDVVTAPDGTQSATFEHGAITYDPATGETDVVDDGPGRRG
jgi:hypothetical protein